MADARVGQIAFGPFRMDLGGGRLIRDGCDLEIRPQAFHVLRTLIQNCGKNVDYERMIHQAWDGVSVSRHTVAVTVGEAKNDRALDGLERAWEENSVPLFILDVDPKMDPLRGQPRFERIRNRVFGRSAHG